MATNTTNLNLIKPSGTDKIRIAQINQNMDILDEKIGPVGNTSLQSQVTSLTVPKRVIAKTITATSQSDLDSQLATECSTFGYGTFEIVELLGNWSGGSSPTNGARSLATLHRINISGAYYMCYVHYTGATGYYYSGSWHWDLGFPAINSQLNPTLLCETGYPLASAETSYNCNWSNYKLLIFAYCFYSNVLMTSVIPASDFNYTTTGRNIYLASDQSVTIQKNGNNAIKVAYSGANQNVQVKVWGVL